MSTVTPSEPPVGEHTELPPLDFPSGLQFVATDGLEQMKEGYAKLAESTEAAEASIEESCATAAQGSAELGLKMIAAMQANINAGFDFAAAMAEARSLPDVIELSSSFAARQLESVVAQGKDLWSAGQKLMSEAARPLATGLSTGVEKAGSS
ncbi:phasin family protein [Rhodoplanes roseus]|uniref:Phasin domain-containing protein n=1 Tax=Rhodoplanes roseus TaxID=29409 RepID=A0A327KXS0_9BRAD|nr:phasin family protein [Rhodoplanes roseus]RAI43061.1 hypothetical protein CH341_16330 [Rhodoplanes roseus]